MSTYFSATELLSPPTERAAFSDRQAYVCAELSKLAYFKFEGGHTLDQVLEIAKQIIADDTQFKILEEQLRKVLTASSSSAAEARDAFEEILNAVDFQLVETFSNQGTQAFICTKTHKLVSGGEKTMVFLTFRGTEPRDFRDIKTDIKARLKGVELDGETVDFHSGYLDSLEHVKSAIVNKLEDTSYDQLFITGHSLGGALAIVFTRLQAASTNGACYTFGAPPVGAVEVQNGLKTPVYEIINEIDVVPRLPNPWLIGATSLLLKLLRLVLKLFTVTQKLLASGTWDEKLEEYVQMMTRYRHPGYRSYLVGSGAAARLRYNVSAYDRLGWWLSMIWKKGFTKFNKMIADHMIDVYIEKLKHHALKRQ